jgi:hypothetical protein
MELLEIINRFIRDQRYVVNLLYHSYGIAPNIKALEWALISSRVKNLHNDKPIATIFRNHGYGIEFKDEQVHIDYDYSITGRLDGFDAWWLYIYCRDNGVQSALTTHEHFIDALRVLNKQGVIEYDNGLYFLPRQ